jgi:hypothetical protein
MNENIRFAQVVLWIPPIQKLHLMRMEFVIIAMTLRKMSYPTGIPMKEVARS